MFERNRSFSKRVKSDLIRVRVERACCRRSEMAAMVHLRGYFTIQQKESYMSIIVDSNAVARYFFMRLKKITGEPPLVLFQRENRLIPSQFIIQIRGGTSLKNLLGYLGLKRGKKWHITPFSFPVQSKPRCCQRSYLRGAFLAAGSLSSPDSGYHLEICSEYEDYAKNIQHLLRNFNIDASIRSRKKIYYTYLKNVEAIMDLLRIIKAYPAILYLEDQRIIKSIKNETNRLVNCETANLDKTISASYRQLQIIEKIDRHLGLNKLSQPLKEVSELRRKYPEASLKELGEMLFPPVGKSGMHHRFRKLKKIAADIG